MDTPDLGAVWLIMRQQTSECVTKTDAMDFVGCSISLKYYRHASSVKQNYLESRQLSRYHILPKRTGQDTNRIRNYRNRLSGRPKQVRLTGITQADYHFCLSPP